jgi:OmcA/MtrC family decaheme c-type cytochrome
VHLKSGEPLRAKLAEAFQLEILGATNVAPGDTPVVTIRVTNPADGSAYDIVNDPEFNQPGGVSSLNLYVAWPTSDIYNGDETGAMLGARSDGGAIDPAFPFRMLLPEIQAAATASGQNADGSYDITYFTALPLNYTGDVMIALGGHPAGNAGTAAAPVWDRAAATSVVFFPGAKREIAVEIDKCNKCHAVLQAHGSNRNNDVGICLTCHNNDASIDDAGTIFGYGFGYMIHNIHAASATWADGLFAEVTFPQSIANCEACHTEGSYNVARATARAVSTNPGGDALGRWDDDTATTANSALCGTCHVSGAAAGHFLSNGGFIDVTKDPGLLGNPPIGQEACAVCHGPGRTFDTTLYHGD